MSVEVKNNEDDEERMTMVDEERMVGVDFGKGVLMDIAIDTGKTFAKHKLGKETFGIFS